jgi:hypothetical protein
MVKMAVGREGRRREGPRKDGGSRCTKYMYVYIGKATDKNRGRRSTRRQRDATDYRPAYNASGKKATCRWTNKAGDSGYHYRASICQYLYGILDIHMPLCHRLLVVEIIFDKCHHSIPTLVCPKIRVRFHRP